MSRDTGTGAAFKEVVDGILTGIASRADLVLERSVVIGEKPNGQPNRIDFTLTRRSNTAVRGLISCKTQSTSGTAEEKVAFEVIRLLRTMKYDSRYRHSWIVLGGSGWSEDLVDFYVNEMKIYVPKMEQNVTILRTDELMSARISI